MEPPSGAVEGITWSQLIVPRPPTALGNVPVPPIFLLGVSAGAAAWAAKRRNVDDRVVMVLKDTIKTVYGVVISSSWGGHLGIVRSVRVLWLDAGRDIPSRYSLREGPGGLIYASRVAFSFQNVSQVGKLSS